MNQDLVGVDFNSSLTVVLPKLPEAACYAPHLAGGSREGMVAMVPIRASVPQNHRLGQRKVCSHCGPKEPDVTGAAPRCGAWMSGGAGSPPLPAP